MVAMESFSRPGSTTKANEDVSYVSDEFGFVIDGATGYGNVKITNDESDAKWYANAWKEFLIRNLSNYNLSMPQIMKQGIVEINDKLSTFPNYSLANLKPSAAIALFRVNGDKLEYFVLADCSLLITKKDGSTQIITTDDITKIDQRNLKFLKFLAHKYNISMLEAKKLPEFKKVMVEMFKNRNTDGGGWVLSDNLNAINFANYGSMNFDDVVSIMAFSDGFSQIFDLFHYMTPNELSQTVIKGHNLEEIYNKLYQLQESDPTCENFPRTKLRDDATAIKYLKLTGLEYFKNSNIERDYAM